jgi:5-methylcytosine-specific restriction endonuclease McrA
MPCPSCGVVERMTIDHVVPLAVGGDNSPANLRWLCRSCNSGKGAGAL